MPASDVENGCFVLRGRHRCNDRMRQSEKKSVERREPEHTHQARTQSGERKRANGEHTETARGGEQAPINSSQRRLKEAGKKRE